MPTRQACSWRGHVACCLLMVPICPCTTAGASAPPSAATRRRQLLVSYVLTGLVILIACSVDSVSVMWAIMGSFACIGEH